MTQPTANDINDGIAVLKAMVERHHGPDPATLDHPTIKRWELDYRRALRPRFRAWLDRRGEPIDADEVDALAKGMNLFNYEDHDLRILLRHPDNVSLVEALREHLDDARKAYEPATAIRDVVGVIERMEANAREHKEKSKKKLVNGVKTKWTVPTTLLSFADSRYPFIRPSNTGSDAGPVRDRIFTGLPWQSTVSPERYVEYCERYALICAAMEEAGVAAGGASPADASAWMVAVHSLSKEPPELQRLVKLVKSGPTILQGPPGTGKTHRVERLAKSLTKSDKPVVLPADRFDGSQKADVVKELVQFHASYDYEDFVRGFRPVASAHGVAFRLQDGPFARMVSWALQHRETLFLLIVDEINRADLARVLGECIYLLDRQVPRSKVESVWSGKEPGAAALRYVPSTPATSFADYDPSTERLLAKLCVPDNFFLVGTMNTADRSIAVVDAALRRRFNFDDVNPDPDVVEKAGEVDRAVRRRFQAWMARLNGDGEGTDGLIRDPRHHIGHSYFLGESDRVRSKVRYQLLPLLEEYRRERRFAGDEAQVDALFDEMIEFSK